MSSYPTLIFRAKSFLLFLFTCLVGSKLMAQHQISSRSVAVKVYPDSVLNDVSNHPLGINLDYFMDDDKYLHPKIRLSDALKTMGVKYLRYPGGNKSDFYLFSKPPYDRSDATLARTGKDAVGGRNRALNTSATGFKNDVLDFDEFMTVCHEVGAEPVIVVAADEYLVNYPPGSTWSTRHELLKNAVEWVRYANVKKKYGVKYWMIGNESWGPENANSNADIYAKDVEDFSTEMKKVDPSISIIPNGNTGDWWKTILTKDAGYIDAVCLSNYPFYKLPNGFATYRDSALDLMHPVNTALAAIRKYAPELKVIVAEYGPYNWGSNNWPSINNMGYNLANFEITGEQLKQPKIKFSCFWNTRWIENDSVQYDVVDALNKDGELNANGTGLMIWCKYLKKQMIKTTSTTHLRTFASYDPSDKSLFVYLINKSPEAACVQPVFPGHRIKRLKQIWTTVSTGPDDVHPVWRRLKHPEEGVLNVSGTSIQVVEYLLK